MATSSPKTAPVKVPRRAGGSAGKPDAVRLTAVSKRRSVPYAVLGGALAIAFAIVFAATSLNVGGKSPYLELVKPIEAGQVIEAADLSTVQLSGGSAAGLIPASSRSSVVGESATMPLAAGTLLTRGEVGSASFPPVGESVVAVAVTATQYPAELTAGSHVLVATAAASGGGGATAVPLAQAPSAVVVSVNPSTNSATGTVSLLTDTASASAISAIPSSQVQLVLTSPSGS
jgi:hypothetical protein